MRSTLSGRFPITFESGTASASVLLGWAEKEIDRKVFIQAEEIQRPKQTIFDPRDLSLKLGKKASKGWVGSKCHVVETAQKEKINFITNMIYQQAQAHDCNIHEKLREGNECRGLHPEKVYADMSYINDGAICGYYEYVRERREKQQSEAFRKEMSVRAQIEGTISEGTRFHGLRHARYHGEVGHQMQFYLTGATINVKRLIRAMTRGIDIPTKPALA